MTAYHVEQYLQRVIEPKEFTDQSEGHQYQVEKRHMFDGPGDTILIVEDDPQINRLFCKQLLTLGVRVESVFSVADALNYLENRLPPSVIILDLELKDGHGRVILEQLTAPRFRSCRKVIVSGHTFSQQDIDLNQVDYALLKPVSPRGLKALVEMLAREGGG